MDTGRTDEPGAFSNPPVDADGLPRLAQHAFEALDPTYARVRSIAAGIVAAIVIVLTLAGTAVTMSTAPLLVGSVAVAVVAVVGIAHRIETNHMGYLVREHDVSFCSGVIGREVATAPFARVQHVSIARGPLDRRFGLAALQLRTAGGHIAIPGLRHDTAERLKQLVADRAGSLADAETDAVAAPVATNDPHDARGIDSAHESDHTGPTDHTHGACAANDVRVGNDTGETNDTDAA